jgi:hypothetical protein
MYRNVILCVFLLALGCNADESAANNGPDASADTSANANIACDQCGTAPMCGTSCDDECGCCCEEGDERNGGLERCTANNCWEPVNAPNNNTPDMGTPDAATDLGGPDQGDVGVDASPDAASIACTKSPNGSSPPTDTCMHGAAQWLAWEWIPDENMTITELRLHTDEGFGALLADDGTGKPGAVLQEGVLSDADPDGWRTLTFGVPTAVTAATQYWIGEDVLTCSTAEDGTEFTYYSADTTAGPWNGPLNAHPFTAQIEGTCP